MDASSSPAASDRVRNFDQLPGSALLTVREFMVLAGVAEPTVRRWIAEGKVGVVRHGARCVRVPVAEARKHVAGALAA